ncbi:MAG: PAS domain S-box protein [Kouleothrix sp.]|nr:PAS domain S-box protein [Kouleothrix sp.]
MQPSLSRADRPAVSLCRRALGWSIPLALALGLAALAGGALQRSPALALAGLLACAQAALMLWLYLPLRRLPDGALAQSQDDQLLTLALSAIGANLWACDLVTGKFQLLRNSLALLGLADTGAPLTLEDVIAAVHPDDRGFVVAALRDAAQARSSGALEYRVVWPDGSIHWLESHGLIRSDAPGAASYWLGMTIDVTARRLLQGQIRQERDRYSALLQGLSDLGEGVIVGEGDRIVYANDAICQLSGYGRDELLELPSLAVLADPETTSVTGERRRRLMQGGRVAHSEAGLRHRAGHAVPLEFAAKALQQDGRAQYILVARDITERRRAEEDIRRLNDELERRVVQRTAALEASNRLLEGEIAERKIAAEALRRSEARNSAMLNALPDLMFRLRHDGTFLDVHAGDIRDLYVPRDQIVGATLPDLLPPELVGRMQAAIRAVLAQREMQQMEYQLPMPSGLRCYEARLVTCDDDEVLVIVRDITDRKRTERALRASEASNRALLESIPDTIVRLDRDGVVLDCKPARDSAQPRIDARCVGQHIAEVLPLDRQALAEAQSAPQRDQPLSIEFTVPQRLGEYLIDQGQLTQAQLEQALAAHAEQRERGGAALLGQTLVELGLLTPERLGVALEHQRMEGSLNDFEARLISSGESESVMMVRNISERRRAEEHARQQALRTAVIADLTRAIGRAGLEYQHVLDILARSIAESLDVMCVICMLSDDGRWLEPAAYHHTDPILLSTTQAVLAQMRWCADEEPLRSHLLAGRTRRFLPQHAADLAAFIGPAHLEHLAAAQLRSVLATPLRSNGQIVGTLSLIHLGRGPRAATESTAFLEDLADRAALAIDNARLYQTAQRELAERRRVEADLLESNQRFRELAENIPEVFWLLDPVNGLALYVSPAFEAIWGRPYQSAYDPAFSFFKTVLPEDGELIGDLFLRQARGEATETEFRIMRPDGAIRWIWHHSSPLRDTDGRVLRIAAVSADITARKRAEQALRSSEERYRQIVETTVEGVWILDAHGRTTFVNRQMAEMLGYTVEEMLGTFMFDYMDDEWRAIAAGNLGRRAAGIEEQHDFKFLRSGGSELWALVATNPLRDDAGNFVGALGMITDITARKRAEQALRESQHLLQSIAEATPDLIYVWELEERRDVFLNRPIPAALGYGADEIERMGADYFLALMHPDDYARLDEIRRRYRAMSDGETFENEYRLRHASGEWQWLYSRDRVLTRTPEGAPKMMIGTSQNITARKQAEQALTNAYLQMEILNQDLRRSRDLLRMLFDKLKDGLMLLDQDGRVLALNQSLANLLGDQVSNLTGQPWLALCERSASTPCRWVLDTLQDGRARQDRERIAFPDGTLHVLDVEVFPLVSAGLVVEQIMIHTVDVTERLQIEAQMIEQERFAASGRLVATVAHEVNTPLQSVESCLHMAERVDKSRRAEYLKLAREEVIRVGQILRQLLDIFRPNETVSAPIDVNALIGRVLLLTGSTLARQGIRVERDLAPELPPIWGSGNAITQTLLNLVVNAAHAMPQGGTLLLRTSQAAAAIAIEVADSGIGMSPAVQARIFEPFFTTKPDGSGLGLAISEKIVVQHGGTIEVRSTPNAGSAFTIRLPAGDGVRAAEQPARSGDF